VGVSAGGLVVRSLSVDLGEQRVVDAVDLDLARGELLALVGPNGAGKSTLLAAVTGDVTPVRGTVTFDGADLLALAPRPAARVRSVLLQESRLAFGFRVVDVVAMGRTPWHRMPEEDRDGEVVAAAMARTDVSELAGRLFPSLSGGEKGRASLARVLAQETPLVLLDEPTAALDIRHQEQVLAVARELASCGCAVGVVLHDLSLAAAWADRICVLDNGRVAAHGSPGQVLRPELLGRVYGHPVDVISHDGHLVVVPRRPARLVARSTDPEEQPCVSMP
jgi:iron complex transport system ATP-binding protein